MTLQVATDDATLHQQLVWEAHETNWRCELLALDALILGSRNWPEVDQWARESLISETWGPPRSAMDICPDIGAHSQASAWIPPDDPGWEEGRCHLAGFLTVLKRWPDAPSWLARAAAEVEECDPFQFSRFQEDAVAFYVRTFVATFQRLPTPPVRFPRRSE